MTRTRNPRDLGTVRLSISTIEYGQTRMPWCRRRHCAKVHAWSTSIRPASIRAAGHVGAETDLRPVLPTVDVPTLVLHGEADARSPLANGESLHAAIPTSELAVLPGLGHACMVEDPDACARAIRRFVASAG